MIEKNNNYKTGGLLLIILVILVTFYSSIKGERKIISNNNEGTVFIQVDGETEKPGIYAFNPDTRLHDVLKRAGCPVIEADLGKDIKKTGLRSGMKIKVYRKHGNFYIEQSEMSAHHKVTLNIPISLNNESTYGFTAIPGIGTSLSKRITDERSRKGGFSDLRQLKEIPGVGDKVYDKIISYLTL